MVTIKKKFSELRLERPLMTLFMGLFEGISILAFFYALELGNVSNTIFLAYTAPVWSILMAWLFLKEKIEKKTIVSMFIVLFGVLLIVDPRNMSLDLQLGNILAVLAGFFYAAMAMAAKPLLERRSGYYTAFWQYLVITLVFGFASGVDTAGAAENTLALLGLGIMATGVSAVLFMEGIKRVKGQEVFIITSLEPVISSFFAFLILKESIGMLTVAGGLLILLGIYNISKK